MKKIPGAGALALASLALAALASPALGQIPVMLPEFQVNTSPGASSCDGIAAGRDGRFVVTWTEGDSNLDILGRSFDAQGTPLEDPFPVNAITTGNQGSSSVARDASGRLVVVWSDENRSIFGRRFGADGTPLGDSFQINTSTASSLKRRVRPFWQFRRRMELEQRRRRPTLRQRRRSTR